MDRFIRGPYRDASSPDTVDRFVTSWILPPPLLFFWRALVSLYAFVVLFTAIGHNSRYGQAGPSFSYFTVLGYWGLAFYYAFAALHTASYWIRGKSWLQGWPSSLQWAHSCFYSSVTTFPFIVTIVFWAVLANGALSTTYSSWSNISEHILNTVFALFEIVLPRTNPHPWINLIVVIILLALYLALAEITHATQGFYVYLFLDPAWLGHGVVGGACVIILIGTGIVFVVSRYLILLRKYATESVLRMDRKLSPKALHVNQRSVEMGDVSMHTTPIKGHAEGYYTGP